MKSINNAGFTIVETMLFLGISGMLAMGVLVSIGGSINVQRYHDSVTSLRSILQQQYSNVANVSNESTGTRGQSDSVVLGKLIKSTDDNTKLSIQTVVGKIPSSSVAINDAEALSEYSIETLQDSDEIYDIEWGASAKQLVSSGGDNMIFSILILRSPTSGVIRTFIDTKLVSTDAELKALLNDTSSLKNSATICLDSGSSFITKMAVFVEANSTGPSGVQVKGDNSGC